jgi:basic amino acid/polyamine antiporter, APA family
MATDNNAVDAARGSGLARRLGLGTATALIVGNVIGVGIFLTPADMAKSLGSPFWLLVVWVLMALSTIGGALCYGALAVRYPEAGGTYIYLREVFGRRAAFLYGWLSLLVTDPGLTAMLAMGLASYVGHLVPLAPWGLKAVAVGSIIALAAVNTLGVRPGSRVMGALTVFKLGSLGFLVIWGFGMGRGNWSNLTPFWSQRPGSDPFLKALGMALVGAFIAFAGWWDVSKIAGEVRDPKKTMPRALMLGVSIVTVIYIAVTVVFLYLVAPARIAEDSGAFAALAGEALFGRRGEVIFSLVVIISVTGTIAGYLMAAPRVYFAMARDGLFFASFGVIDPRRDVPARGTVVQATLAVALALAFSFDQILSYIMIPTLLFLALTVSGIFVLHRRHPGERALAPLGYPISPLLFLIPMVTVILLQILRYPGPGLIGLTLVVLGVPVAVWLIPEHRSSGQSNAPDSTAKPANPDSTLDEPSAVPSVGTHS